MSNYSHFEGYYWGYDDYQLTWRWFLTTHSFDENNILAKLEATLHYYKLPLSTPIGIVGVCVGTAQHVLLYCRDVSPDMLARLKIMSVPSMLRSSIEQ